jgi:hypothetical protein
MGEMELGRERVRGHHRKIMAAWEFKIINEKLDKILGVLGVIRQEEKKMSVELEELTAEVTETKGIEESAVVLIQGIAAALAAAGSDPVKLKALRDDLKVSTDALAAAIAANPLPATPTT